MGGWICASLLGQLVPEEASGVYGTLMDRNSISPFFLYELDVRCAHEY